MKWFVSRQIYWGVDPEDQYCVEIAFGGLDSANPDMLVSKYDGEGEEYTNPRKAVEAALAIRDQWKVDRPDLTINVAHGATGGNTIPFEGDTDEALKEWANKVYENLPKCERCGELIESEPYVLCDARFMDLRFCSRYCAEEYNYEDERINMEEKL